MKLVTKYKGLIKIIVPPYRARVYVGDIRKTNTFPEEFRELFKEDDSHIGAVAQVREIENNKGQWALFVLLPKGFDDATLLHESIHCAHAILRSRGVEVSVSNDEAVTYLTEWIYYLIKTSFYKKSGDKIYG